MLQKTATTLLLSALFAGFAGSADADTVLFADDFNRANNTNLNDAATGKSGTLGALNWVEVKSGAEPTITSNTLRLGESAGTPTSGGGGGWSIAYVNHNFTDALISTGGEFTVEVDLVGPVSSAGGTRFQGFIVGNSLAEVNAWAFNNPASTFTSDFFFGYDTTGTNEVKVFKNGTTQDFQSTVNLDTGATLSVRFSGITSFNAGATVNYEAFINGGSVKSGSFTWSGTNENYIALYSNYTGMNGILDNFSVSAVPEPTSLALLGLGSLLIARRRRG